MKGNDAELKEAFQIMKLIFVVLLSLVVFCFLIAFLYFSFFPVHVSAPQTIPERFKAIFLWTLAWMSARKGGF